MTLLLYGTELNRRLTVWRPVTTTDAYGGETVALVEQDEPVWGQVSQPTAEEQVAAQTARTNLSITVHLRPESDVHRGDELHDDAGDVLRVESTLAPSVPGVYLRANCERFQSEGR